MMKKKKMVNSLIWLSIEIMVFIIGIIATMFISVLFITGYCSATDDPELWNCNVALVVALIICVYPIVQEYDKIIDLLYDEEDS